MATFKLITIISVFGLVFASVYALWMMQQVYYGSPKTAERTYKGLNLREFFDPVYLGGFIGYFGLLPTTSIRYFDISNGKSPDLVFRFFFNSKAVIRHDNNS